MITDMLFAQYSPAPGESATLYTVPIGSTAKGTLFIAARNGSDIVSVALIPKDQSLEPKHYILYTRPLIGNVPIYLQLLYFGEGDSIFISSIYGDSSFTFTGEKYT